jgi:hypothetical protein
MPELNPDFFNCCVETLGNLFAYGLEGIFFLLYGVS